MRSFIRWVPLMLTVFVGFSNCSNSSSGKQFVATMQPEEPIEGVCNMEKIYVMLPTMDGQVQAEPPVEMDSLQMRMNKELDYLEEHPTHNDSGMVNVVVNCEGKVVRSEIDGNSKTKSKELDREVEEVFANTGDWKPAKYQGRSVDSNRLISFVITKGSFRFE